MLRNQFVKLESQIASARSSPRKESPYIVDYAQLEMSYSKLQKENRRNSALAEKAIEYQRLLDQSQTQIQRLNDVVQEKADEVEHWRQKAMRSETYLQEIKNTKDAYSIPQSRVRHLEQQIQRIQSQISRKNNLIEDWKLKYLSLERLAANSKVLQNEKLGLQDQLRYQSKIIDDYQRKVRYLEDATSHLHQLQNELQNESSRRIEFVEEIQRLNNLLQIKSDQCQNLTKKIQTISKQVQCFQSLEKQLLGEKRKSQQFNEKIAEIYLIIDQKQKVVAQIGEQYLKEGLYQKQLWKQILEKSSEEISQLYSKLARANTASDKFQLQLMSANSQITNLKMEIKMVSIQKQSLINSLQQKSGELQSAQNEALARLNEIKQMRKFQTSLYQTQVKLKNFEENYSQLDKRWKKQCQRSEKFDRQNSVMRAELQKIKRDGYYSPQLLSQFASLKKDYQTKERELRSLDAKFVVVQKMLNILKREFIKNLQMVKSNKGKWLKIDNGISCFTEFAQKSIEMHNELGKVSLENIELQSCSRVLNIELNTSRIAKRCIVLPGRSHKKSKSFANEQSGSETSSIIWKQNFEEGSQKEKSTQQKSSPEQAIDTPTVFKKSIMRKSAVEPVSSYQSRYQSRLLYKKQREL